LRLEAMDVGDPAEIGKQVSYHVEVENTGNLPANQVQIKAFIPEEMEVLGATGPTKFKTEKLKGTVLTFEKIEALQPGKTEVFNIEVKAVKSGDVRFRVELTSLALQQPVLEEESTTIVDPGAPAAAAAVEPAGNPPPPPPPPPAAAAAPATAVPPVPPPVVPKPNT
jgi:uncharacterized repeat protein (TIGR01451 family)